MDVQKTLEENILPFWAEKMADTRRGGFYGQMCGDGTLREDAPKGAILCGRILWSFSAAYRVLGKKSYLDSADRAKSYLLDHFIDKEFGGVYWSVDCEGNPLDTKKQFYAIGFAIYGLSEYVRATGDKKALEAAVELFRSIEEHSFDPKAGGYFEACTRDWRPIEDMRLSDRDENTAKTMNTHLHIMEPYTNLLRVWDDPLLRNKLHALVELFLDKIEDPVTHHLGLFFDENWVRKDKGVSYGHDIEASWLILEAAEVLGDEALLERVRKDVKLIYKAALEGLQTDGSMIYEIRGDGSVDTDRHWWVQAETAVGAHYAGDEAVRDAALEYIAGHLVDWKDGEWHWSVHEDGSVNLTDDKAGFWKCPYHNSRMCLEILTR